MSLFCSGAQGLNDSLACFKALMLVLDPCRFVESQWLFGRKSNPATADAAT